MFSSVSGFGYDMDERGGKVNSVKPVTKWSAS